MEVVLDTCAVVWAAVQPEQLSPRARAVVDNPGNDFVISTISVWEVALKVHKKTLDLGFPVAELVRRLRRRENVELVPVDAETWLRSAELPWAHRDPADRAIVALADLRKVPIVTGDTHISVYYHNVIW
jgi:PIN domain nuclease of toxin-antitoxin system